MTSTVTISAGQLEGTELADGVHAFLGVPYAAPPVGSLRFAPPAPHAGWDGVRPATAHGAAPPQGSPAPGRPIVDLSVPAEDEDCLTVAVWTPSVDPGAKLPVMVWVYGGAFAAGGASVAAYDGAALAARGVVVVNINYRLGILGWLRSAELGASGNQGLADQAAAFEWVRDEIAAFGGDPAKVTVFGESAGSASIVAHLARGGDLPFRRAVLQSGAHNLCKSVAEADQTAALVTAVLDGDISALAAMPLAELIELQDRALPRSGGIFFGPVTDGDLVPADPAGALAAGSAAGIDVIAGSNRDEMGFFWGRDERFDEIDDDFLSGIVGRWSSDPATAIERYRVARSGQGEATDNRSIAVAMGSDTTFRAPVAQVAGWQSEHANAWSYLFEWESPLYDGLVRSAHTLEIPFVFGAHDIPECKDFTGGASVTADALSELMMSTWVRFASGDEPGWDRYDPTTRATRILGPNSRTENNPAGDELDVWST